MSDVINISHSLESYHSLLAEKYEMSEKFSLKWNDFETNVSKSFRQLRNQTDFYDVTLVSSDKQQLSAHKLVLSSCSEYFKNILKQNKHSNPLLCLEGISSMELTNVLDYIYNGELQIYQENLERFLEIAARFQLEGLIGGEAGDNFNNSKDFDHNEVLDEKDSKWQSKKREFHNNVTSEFVSENKTIVNVKTLNMENFNSQNFQNMEELDQKIRELMEKDSNGMFRCTVCGKIFKNPGHTREHVETHIEGLSFSCSYCGKEFRSRNSMRSHYRFHK